MTLIERLIHLADAWAAANNRSVARLATRVANDGKLFDRLRGGSTLNVATAERFFGFFREGTNWPEGVVPAIVGETLDGVDLAAARAVEEHDDGNNPAAALASPGKGDAITAGAAA